MTESFQRATQSLRDARQRWVLKRWFRWLYELVRSAISAAGNAVGLMIIDPQTFNLHEWRKLVGFMGISALISAGLFLKTQPLPPLDDEEDVDRHPRRRRHKETTDEH